MSSILDRLASVTERFRRVASAAPARTLVRPAPAPHQPTEAEVLHALVGPWARSAPEAFDTHLASAAEQAHRYVEETRKEHAESNFWLGYERAIRDVRGAFVQWSHPNAGTPAPEATALQGGSNAEPE